MSTSTDRLVSQDSPGERRFYSRITPTRLIYIGFGANNTGMLLNIGENGIMVSTPMGLKVNSAYRVSIRLNGIPNPIEVNVCVVWTTESRRRSGIQMLDLSDFDREQIRKWTALEVAVREKSPETAASAPALGGELEEPQEPYFAPRQPSIAPPPKLEESPKVDPAVAKKPERPSTPVFAPKPVVTQTVKTAMPQVSDPAAAPLAPPAPRQLDFPPSHHLAAIQATRSRSSLPALVAWGLLGATVCGAAAVFFVPSLSQKFLAPLGLHVSAPAASYTPAPPPEVSTAQSPQSDGSSNASRAVSEPPASSRRVDTSYNRTPDTNPGAKPFGSKLTASRPVRQTAETAAGESDADASFAAPNLSENETTAALPSKAAPTTAQSQPTAPTAAPPAPSQTASAANPQPTTRVATTAPNSSAPPARSAITGSIVGSLSQPTAPSANPNNSGSTWNATRSPASAGRSSFFHPGSNSGVVNMDPGEDTVTEITPPRGLLASFMNLPGERVLESPGITMHIQRSVRVPADRWIVLREHKKLILGRLTSRVDPQVSHLPPGSGSLTVEATIDKDGRITNVKPINGASSFLPGVTRAVWQWRYEPTYIDNKPVETRAQIELDFHPQSVRTMRP